MIYSISILPASRRHDPVAKIPANALARTTEVGLSVSGVKAKIAEFWATFRTRPGETPGPETFIQLDIIEGRKPAGFSAAAKACELGENVHVTRKTREPVGV